MKKGMGSMIVLGSYLTTMRNSVTVIAATNHACWPSFLWNFLVKKHYKLCYYGKANYLFIGKLVMWAVHKHTPQ